VIGHKSVAKSQAVEHVSLHKMMWVRIPHSV